MAIYPVNYHREIDQKEPAKNPATEIITEINAPRDALGSFLAEVRDHFRKNNVDLILNMHTECQDLGQWPSGSAAVSHSAQYYATKKTTL